MYQRERRGDYNLVVVYSGYGALRACVRACMSQLLASRHLPAEGYIIMASLFVCARARAQRCDDGTTLSARMWSGAREIRERMAIISLLYLL